MEFAANPTLDEVCTGGLMVTKTVAAVTPQWFGHPGAKVESPPATLFDTGSLAAGSFLDFGMA